SAVGSVSLADANSVPVLAGQATGAGNSVLFRDNGQSLTVGTAPTLLETGTGTPPSNQMLSVAGLSGVTANNGNILLETTTSGNLALNQAVNAGTGLVTLSSVARTQSDAGAAVTLSDPANAVSGNVTLSALNTAGNAPASGAIDFVDGTGFTIAAQPSNGINGQEIGINTTANVTLQAGGDFLTAGGGTSTLTVSGFISSGGGLVGLAAGMGGILISGSIASAPSSLGLGLFSTGPISQIATGSISVPNVLALTENGAGAPITLIGAGNRVNAVTLSTLNGLGNPAGPGPAPGKISFVDSKDFQISFVDSND